MTEFCQQRLQPISPLFIFHSLLFASCSLQSRLAQGGNMPLQHRRLFNGNSLLVDF
jgi:hypothetical protein